MYKFSLGKLSGADRLRNLASYWNISPAAKERLEWIIFYQTVGKRNARVTASYFGVSRKTLHKWLKRFDPFIIQSLEEKSKAPHKKRVWEVTKTEEERIVSLRKKYLKYGKAKLKVLYHKEFKENVSTWKIERVVRKHNLYPDPEEYKKKFKRLRNNSHLKKTRIHELKDKYPDIPAGTLWHTDSVVIWWYGARRIIFTAIEDKTKLGFARVVNNQSSSQAKDFLKRLIYLSHGTIQIIHSDNGGEFAGQFRKTCEELNIKQVYSRVRTPKDNPCLERFNWTVQDEWLSMSEVGLDEIQEANLDLTNWLIEYNSIRPHESLDYQTPLEYAQEKYFKVLPMWSAGTSLLFLK
jgi:transposase InsO family protein